jgi:hypothetical protein
VSALGKSRKAGEVVVESLAPSHYKLRTVLKSEMLPYNYTVPKKIETKLLFFGAG